MSPTWRVLVGDVREKLAELPDASVQCVVTSPPYWGLRDYGVEGQIGLEPTPDAFVASLVDVFQGVWRVLKDDGVCWLNLGDSYAGSFGAQSRGNEGAAPLSSKQSSGRDPAVWGTGRPVNAKVEGLKSKDLCGIPWRVAFALQADGWYLRSDIIWAKPNPMPESVTDRPTKSHEYVFLLSKAERYYYDADAIAEPATRFLRPSEEKGGFYHAGEYGERGAQHGRALKWGKKEQSSHMLGTPRNDGDRWREVDGGVAPRGLGRNCRTVWTITTQPYPDAHFATFPEALPERCIKAGSRLGDTVLDPFCGSGTTGQVAIQLGRSFIGIELNPAYAELSRTRIGGAAPLFSSEAAS